MEENRVLTETEKNWAMLCHLSALSGFFLFPFGGIIGPLICWLTKRDESEWIKINGREAINFNLSILLYIILSIPLVFLIVGGPIIMALVIMKVIFIVMASIKAGRGEMFRYPLSIPFVQ